MRKAGIIALFVLALPCFFALGIYAGPMAANAYASVFPEPGFRTGQFDELYAWAGEEVVMFSDSTCPFCEKARNLLDSSGVAYRELLVDQSAEAKAEFDRRGGVGVPMIFLADRKIIGFREQAIRDGLALVENQ